ncbi:hypothetical protein ACFY1A_31990 [Streptomyces sp. NPDC001520]|uniref:hypothetical protein n=1 Tax=Streptomyces sp. NPDC001520 TaxID=3364581 RepID=UPI0036B1EFC5
MSNPTTTAITVSVNANPRIAKETTGWMWSPPRPRGTRTATAHKVSGIRPALTA